MIAGRNHKGMYENDGASYVQWFFHDVDPKDQSDDLCGSRSRVRGVGLDAEGSHVDGIRVAPAASNVDTSLTHCCVL